MSSGKWRPFCLCLKVLMRWGESHNKHIYINTMDELWAIYCEYFGHIGKPYYSALPISRGHFSSNNSRKTAIARP